MVRKHEHEERQERLLKKLLAIERHEDEMMRAMVQLGASSERLNRRLAGLTWVMLVLTWTTFIVAIPNTLATIFGIPKISEAIGLEVIVLALVLSTVGALVIVVLPRSVFSIYNLEKRSEKHLEE
jgi:Mg2+ and Co2+ transporter CorA